MRIFQKNESWLIFDTGPQGTEWARFERTEKGELLIDSFDGPELSKKDIRILKKWLEETF